jgi:hypothetical protein
VVVGEERLDEQDTSWLEELTTTLSRTCSCSALGTIVHDSDILMLALATNGELIDAYNSCPGYFDGSPREDDLRPRGGKPLELAEAFGAPDVQAIANVLSAGGPAAEVGGYTFEDDRLVDLCEALGAPRWAASFCYAAAERGEFPEGLTANCVERV